MDINDQLQPIVASLIDGLKIQIEQQLRSQVNEEVVKRIASTEITAVVESIIIQRINDQLTEYNFKVITKDQTDAIVSGLTADIHTTLVASAKQQIAAEIKNQLTSFNLIDVAGNLVENKLSELTQTYKFPEKSIPTNSLDLTGFVLSGDQVKGGIIDQFGSTGIEDRSTFVQLTLMDHASAFEGPVWAPEVKVKGNLTVEGDVVLLGKLQEDCAGFTSLVDASAEKVRTNLNTELFNGYSNLLFDKIRADGVDMDRITQGGREVVKGNQLGYHIVDTNIQRVGMVRDLQTQGESYLSETLYTSNKRVGINTMDPSNALTVWDEEIEVIVSKRRQDVGYIATPRNQDLILGANGNENITLNADGSVQVKNITIGDVAMSSAAIPPSYEGTPGEIIWNSAPDHGTAIGWVCLGSTRWAKFGTVE